MELINLFIEGGTASTLLFLSLTGISGVLIGKIQVSRIKLGIAGVLFSGLLIGHLGARFNEEVLHFVKEFGLILFVYSIGLEVGPRFLPSLRHNGLKLNFLAVGIVLLGFVIAFVLKLVLDIPSPVIAGIMCGAVTNTPGLGAAQQVISEQMTNQEGLSQLSGMAYAVAYPFGILGIILTMILLRYFFRISVKDENEKYQRDVSGLSGKPEAVNLKVVNQALAGKTISFLRSTLSGEFVLSRMWRNGEFFIPEEVEVIRPGDILYGVSTEQNFQDLELKVGPVSKTGNLEVSGKLGMKHVVFTNKNMAGKTIGQIGLSRHFPVNITRIFRNSWQQRKTRWNLEIPCVSLENGKL